VFACALQLSVDVRAGAASSAEDVYLIAEMLRLAPNWSLLCKKRFNSSAYVLYHERSVSLCNLHSYKHLLHGMQTCNHETSNVTPTPICKQHWAGDAIDATCGTQNTCLPACELKFCAGGSRLVCTDCANKMPSMAFNYPGECCGYTRTGDTRRLCRPRTKPLRVWQLSADL